MAKKMYKFQYNGLEIRSSDLDAFMDLEQLFNKVSIYERNLGHLKECEKYQKLADSIIPELGAQI